MIVNSSGDNTQVMDPQSQQNENYILKRKLNIDLLESNQSYVQPKKRLIQNFSNNFIEQCNENFHLNGNGFNTECNGIELISFDGVTLVPPIQTTTVFTSTGNGENFDTTWNSADLLELDQSYNTIVNLDSNCPNFEKITSSCNEEQNERLSNPNSSSDVPSEQEQNDMDFDDRNLSWLFNFKLDELPHLSPEVNRSGQLSPSDKHKQNASNIQHQLRTGRKVDDLITEVTADMDDNEMTIAENVVVENTPRMPKKPPFTYTELIEYALEDKKELTVSGIYQWISDRFPFYKSNDDRWKNSVRHNLSINPHFRKGVKAAQGAGHLWTISNQTSEENNLAWQHKKQRLELFFKLEQSNQQKTSTQSENTTSSFDETAAAVANISQHIHHESLSPNSVQTIRSNEDLNSMPIGIMNRKNDLERTAGEILNGVHREVEVQSIHSTIITYQDSILEDDFLNSTSEKDHLIADPSLRINHHHNHHNDIDSTFYVTEIDPVELGINMSNVEEEVLFSDEFNLNYFGITAGSDIVA